MDDVGETQPMYDSPSKPEGVLPIVLRRFFAERGDGEPELTKQKWGVRLPKQPRRDKPQGLDGDAIKAYRWYREAIRRGCNAIVILLDTDSRDPGERRDEISSGYRVAAARDREIIAVAAEAVRTLEAWLLADLDALGQHLGDGENVALPAGKSPEELWGNRRETGSNHPKCVFERLAGAADKIPDAKLKSAIAEDIDFETVRDQCPQGFDRLLADLAESFPAPS